ncbi:hypothetical protein LUZ60_008260 [Juncus effusus]|nr:hypothetical protein LUZ60_008260 [Juncus effusus]
MDGGGLLPLFNLDSCRATALGHTVLSLFVATPNSTNRTSYELPPFTMHAFSPADGFFTVKKGVDDMIKYLANEPSVGLYFVQQHAQASMPNLLSVQEKVSEKVHEVALHTEDIEDSICVVKSMEEFGLIENPSWGFQFIQPGSNVPETSDSTGLSSRNYFTSMFKSARQKAASFKWTSSQNLIVTDNKGTNSEAMMSPTNHLDEPVENSSMSDNANLL